MVKNSSDLPRFSGCFGVDVGNDQLAGEEHHPTSPASQLQPTSSFVAPFVELQRINDRKTQITRHEHVCLSCRKPFLWECKEKKEVTDLGVEGKESMWEHTPFQKVFWLAHSWQYAHHCVVFFSIHGSFGTHYLCLCLSPIVILVNQKDLLLGTLVKGSWCAERNTHTPSQKRNKVNVFWSTHNFCCLWSISWYKTLDK